MFWFWLSQVGLKGYDYSQAGAYFVTVCVQDRRCLLGNVDDNGVVLSPVGKFVYQCFNQIPDRFDTVELDEFVIMPNHIHAILVFDVGARFIVPYKRGFDKSNPYGNMFKKITNQSTLKSAFQRVKENSGCAGVDRITVEEFDKNIRRNIDTLSNELLTVSYQPLPLLRILVDKGNGEARALSIPTVRDRVAQTAALDVIEPLFEAEFEHCSYAYRKGRSVKQAVYKIKEYYEDGYVWVVDADIDAFFDSVDHDILFKEHGDGPL